jgi:trimeric autotransporter adhesin
MRILCLAALAATLSMPALAQNASEIEQVGNDHAAEVTQTGLGTNKATVEQSGDHTYTWLTQDSFVSAAVSQNTAAIEQSGTELRVRAEQNGSASISGLAVKQGGFGSLIDVTQNAIRSDVMADIEQVGTTNTVLIQQGGIEGKLGINISQKGSESTVGAFQTANEAAEMHIDIKIDGGSLNTADVTQTNLMGPGVFASADIKQVGDGNIASVNQQLDHFAKATASIIQTGTGNYLEVKQDLQEAEATASIAHIGSYNRTFVDQYGTGPLVSQVSEISLNGDQNDVTVVQGALNPGTSNTSAIAIIGNGNTAVVKQN